MTEFFMCVLTFAGMWRVFEKAGIEGWKAFIPVYNTWNLVKMVNRPTIFFWWMTSGIILLFGMIVLWGSVAFISGTLGIASSATNAGLTSLVAITSTVGIVILVIFHCILTNDVAKSFGKGIGTTIGLILFPPIFYPILGFGKSKFTKIER